MRWRSITAVGMMSLWFLPSGAAAQRRFTADDNPAPKLGMAALARTASGRSADSLNFRYEYTGYTSIGAPQDCPAARRNGKLVVEGTLQRSRGAPPGNVYYDGKGRATWIWTTAA